MTVLCNVGALAVCPDAGGQGELGLVRDAAIAFDEAGIRWVGRARDLPESERAGPVLDARGALVIPGLVDSHTHLAFAGERMSEHARRIAGESYLAIAQSGGGIKVTVDATRAASKQALIARAERVLDEMAKQGVTSIEAKSGYGLDLENELKQLEVYGALEKMQPIEITKTLLSAHIVPPEHKHDREAYVRLVIEQILPRVAERKLAQFCDVFLEESAFSFEESRRILEAAKRLGLGVKVHADQLTDSGGGRLSAALGAASADHLERTSDTDLRNMAEAGVVGVTLPLALLYTFETPLDARRLLAQGVRVGVATDFNPGSAPSYNIKLALLLACTLNRLTPAQALKGATLYGAQAIGRAHEIGSLEVGKQADLAVVDAESPEAWVTEARPGFAIATFKRGKLIHGSLAAMES